MKNLILLFLFSASTVLATLTFNDGQYYVISTVNNDTVSIDYQTPDKGTTVEIIQGGSVGTTNVYHNGVLKVNGGSCGYLFLHDNSEAYLNGSHGRLAVIDYSKLYVYYSTVNTSLNLAGNSEVILYGYDFKIDGQPVNYGTYGIADLPPKNPNSDGNFYYRLSGYSKNGGSLGFSLFMNGENTRVTLVPEPVTLALLGLGAFLISKKK
jgi:hypothetical protein